MPGWRRRLRCRRREVITMTTVCCVAVLCIYSLALSWCLSLPRLSPEGEEGRFLGVDGGGGDGSPQDPLSPILAARKLHFDAAARAPQGLQRVAASSASSSSISSSPRGNKANGASSILLQKHHRTLQFSHNALKDGWGSSNTGVLLDNSVAEVNNKKSKDVKTMHQKRQHDSGSSRTQDGVSSTIYVEEESEDSGEEGWGTQEYEDNAANSSTPGSRRLPGAIIIGVKKAGTRALLEFLRLHPDVRAPGPEPHFFDRNYNRGLDWYKSLMPATQPGQLTMEKTPSYFITREVPKRLASVSRHAKLLVVVRDPVTRAISDYVQAASKREGKMKSFEDMALLDRKLGIVNTSWGAVRIGVYSKHLERWFQAFPRHQFHFVSGERLIEDPATVMKEVQEFLGLSQFVGERHFYLNATRGFPCLIKYPEKNSRPHCLGKTKGRRHPRVDPKVLDRLRDFYRPFNAKLYQMVGRDFGWS